MKARRLVHRRSWSWDLEEGAMGTCYQELVKGAQVKWKTNVRGKKGRRDRKWVTKGTVTETWGGYSCIRGIDTEKVAWFDETLPPREDPVSLPEQEGTWKQQASAKKLNLGPGAGLSETFRGKVQSSQGKPCTFLVRKGVICFSESLAWLLQQEESLVFAVPWRQQLISAWRPFPAQPQVWPGWRSAPGCHTLAGRSWHVFNKKLSFLFCSLKCLQDNFWESVCPIKGRKWCFWRLIRGLWSAVWLCQFYRRPGAAAPLPASFVETRGLIILHLFSCYYLVRAEMELSGGSVTCFAVGQRIAIFFLLLRRRSLFMEKRTKVSLTEGVGVAACYHHHVWNELPERQGIEMHSNAPGLGLSVFNLGGVIWSLHSTQCSPEKWG